MAIDRCRRALLALLLAAGCGGADQPTGTADLASPADAAIATRFVRMHLGSGTIPDLRSNGNLQLGRESKVHVLLLPEGYTQADLDSGLFGADAAAWLAELWTIEPYTTFKAAFEVWRFDVASADHADVGVAADRTAFAVPLLGDGSVGGELGETARRVWSVVERFDPRPRSFFPSGGRFDRSARNLIVHVLVYDPAKKASGRSGRMTFLENPANSQERVAIALAHDRPHEFSHAFAFLGDEYLLASNPKPIIDPATLESSARITNVVDTASCRALPWKHLLHGAAANPSIDQLVGAFGTPERGYHAELKCLMNGTTSDNAAEFGGNGALRTLGRFCTFCRELTAFRLHERIHVLEDPLNSWQTWIDHYRAPYYRLFPIVAPDPLPQPNSDGTPIFRPCTP